ncbi:hypothetical protein C2W62_16775 [Candidatus Entotheonella serta]|nr:hypothetical protein C2W62_16775 [Candidatus Entotheonella serta]
MGAGGRRQEIRFERQGDAYVMTSIVLARALVNQTAARRRELARLAWHRNAEYDLVTFAFDANDCLVGQIRHPAAHLDYEEFACYVHALARECDRFEFLLSGSDLF